MLLKKSVQIWRLLIAIFVKLHKLQEVGGNAMCTFGLFHNLHLRIGKIVHVWAMSDLLSDRIVSRGSAEGRMSVCLNTSMSTSTVQLIV